MSFILFLTFDSLDWFSISISTLTLIVGIIAIWFTWDLHKRRQVSMLISCLKQLNLIEQDSTSFKEVLSKGGLPLYPIKTISAIELSINLDAKIRRRSTIRLKKLLFNINDKVLLINSYLKYILEEFIEFKKYSKLNNDEDFSKKSRLYGYFKPKLEATIPELDRFIKDAKYILNLGFDIN